MELLTVEGDDVLYLHMKDILARKCKVVLDNLNAGNISELQEELKELNVPETSAETEELK